MFNLLRYFSLTSAAAMIVATTVIVVIFHDHETNDYVEHAQIANSRLATVFSNVFLKEFTPLIQTMAASETEKLRQRGELRALDIVFRTLTAASSVLKVKIYDIRGRIIYSSDRTDIGGTSGMPASLSAALAGRTVSKLFFRSSFVGWSGPVTDRYLVTTYIPLLGGDNAVVGVFELYTDVTAETADLHTTVVNVASIMVVVFMSLYGALFLVMRRADRIMVAQQRDLEMSRAEHQEQENMLRLLLNAVGEGIYGMDDKGNVTFVNPAAARLIGWSADDLIGRRMHDVIHHTRADDTPFPAIECPVYATLVEGMPREVTGEVFWRKDGTSLPVEYTATPIYRHGVVTGAVTIFRDVSDRLREEEALLRSNQRLNSFAHAVSHDLQEPLRMVVSYLQLLKRNYGGRLDADAEQFIGYAVNGAKRMKALIDDLLTYSKVTSQTEPFSSVDMTAALAAALASLDVAIRDSGAVITVDPLPMVDGDAAQIERLLQNLIGNAVKYHRPEANPAIHVAAARQGEAWLFSVSDNGIGIEKEHFDRIFDIFQRLHGREAYEGTGVGLAICKQIVEHHGGRIWVDAVPGEGSTFFFTLPDSSIMSRGLG